MFRGERGRLFLDGPIIKRKFKKKSRMERRCLVLAIKNIPLVGGGARGGILQPATEI